MKKTQKIMLATATALAGVIALAGCSDGTGGSGYNTAYNNSYAQVCENPITLIRVDAYQCAYGAGYGANWLYYPYGYSVPRVGSHVSTSHAVTTVPSKAKVIKGTAVPKTGGYVSPSKSGSVEKPVVTKTKPSVKSKIGSFFKPSGKSNVPAPKTGTSGTGGSTYKAPKSTYKAPTYHAPSHSSYSHH